MSTSTAVARADAPDNFVAAARRVLQGGGELQIVAGEATHPLQGDAAEAVLTLLDAIASGRNFDITTLPDVLTTGQAADLLGVSRPTVVSLIDSGELPASRIGTHRRIETVQLMAFMERRHQASGAAMDELVRVSEELGLYDE